MFTQKLPQVFHFAPSDNKTYCIWIDGSKMKYCPVATWHEAVDFCERASERDVAAFASGIVPGIGGNQRMVFDMSFGGMFKKYRSDRIVMQVKGLAHEFWKEERKEEEKKEKERIFLQQKQNVPQAKHNINIPAWFQALVDIGFDEEPLEYTTNENEEIIETETYSITYCLSSKTYVFCWDSGDYTESWHCWTDDFALAQLNGSWENFEDIHYYTD